MCYDYFEMEKFVPILKNLASSGIWDHKSDLAETLFILLPKEMKKFITKKEILDLRIDCEGHQEFIRRFQEELVSQKIQS